MDIAKLAGIWKNLSEGQKAEIRQLLRNAEEKADDFRDSIEAVKEKWPDKQIPQELEDHAERWHISLMELATIVDEPDQSDIVEMFK
jgi:hypothetical protein